MIKGSHHSEETKEKIRKAQIDKHFLENEGWIKKGQKLRKGKVGYKETESHKENIRKVLKGRIPKNLSLINANKFGENNPMFGKKRTDKWKREHSEKMKGRIPPIKEGKWGNIKRGWYNINNKRMFFRSKWEVNIALYLDFLVKQGQIKSWSYEKKVFIFEKIKFGIRSYRPDFEIINNDNSLEFWEVKGYMDSKSKTKIKRMAKYYPDIELTIIDKDVYGDIKKKLGNLLKFY
jgi:hypothetical protein